MIEKIQIPSSHKYQKHTSRFIVIKSIVMHTCIPSSKSLSDLFKASSSAEFLPTKKEEMVKVLKN